MINSESVPSSPGIDPGVAVGVENALKLSHTAIHNALHLLIHDNTPAGIRACKRKTTDAVRLLASALAEM